MITTALRAGLPLVYAHTTDTVNVVANLAAITKRKIHLFRALDSEAFKSGQTAFKTGAVLVTFDTGAVPHDQLYALATTAEVTVVCVNPNPKCRSVGVNVGQVPPDPKKIAEAVAQLCIKEEIGTVVNALDGLEVKDAREVLLLAFAQGPMNLDRLAHIRRRLIGQEAGILSVPTAQAFYIPDPQLIAYWNQMAPVYHDPPHPELRPKGVMLRGNPGTGKSQAAKWLAHKLGVPLFRVSLSSVMSKWQGESERQFTAGLYQLDASSPCVAFFDEVDKTLKTGDDSGSGGRMLSELLWWMAEHTSNVLVVMTANDMSKVPPELYREGRIDRTMELGEWAPKDALHHAKTLIGVLLKGDAKRRKSVEQRLTQWPGEFPINPSAVRQAVINLVMETYNDD